MSDAPKNSGHCGAADVTLPADNSCDRNDMIGVGGVPHAEKKAEK